MRLQQLPIRRKIMAVIMLTSLTVVTLTVVAFMTYDLTTIRDTTISNLSTMGRIVAANSSAAVTFKNEKDGLETLASLRAEPQIIAAALYDADQNLFVSYPTNQTPDIFPRQPRRAGYDFGLNHIVLYEPVMQDGNWLGTLYMQADLRQFYSRLTLYAAVSVLILLGSVVISYWLSHQLQRHVSNPILALTHTARQISVERDYTVRAPRMSEDELGLLTDAFNQMLTQIEEQTAAIQRSEGRLRLALDASRTGVWDWNLEKGEVIWDENHYTLIGLKHEPGSVITDPFEFIHPEDREATREAINRAIRDNHDFNVEFRVVCPDASIHQMLSRGRATYGPDGNPVRVVGVTTDITERRKAEEERGFLAAIVDSTEDAIIGKDFNGVIRSWNSGAERMLGYTAAEMIGQSVFRITPPDRPEEERHILEQARRGETELFETVRIRKDGRPVDVSLTISPVRTENGRIVGVSSIARNITERKQAERDLQESRARLSGIISSAMDAIISVDAQQRVTLFNAAAEKMFQWPAAEAIGKSLEIFIPKRFREEHRTDVEEFGKTGTTARAMGHLRPLAGLRRNGEEFPIEASISHIEVAGQQIFTVILRDITERTNAQQSLERQARVLREQAQMLDLANVMACDLEDRIILWNMGMERMYGWTRSETLGRSSHEVLRTQSSVPLEDIKEELMKHGQWEGELVHIRKDGRPLTVASQWVLHKDHDGKPVAVLEVNTDITERKIAEQQVRRMNAELEHRVRDRTAELTAANQELEAFTYSVAHDLRAPLRHIDAFTKIIFDDFAEEIPAEAKRYLEHIRRGSQNMSQLVDDLLNLARVGRQELKREPTALNPIVEEVVADLKRETGSRDVEWHIDSLPSAVSDPGLIKQVFANLLSNAVKYTRPRPRAVIEVGKRNIGDETVIYVQDNGVGFNMKYADKLFGVFQRLHRADEFEGTGVGLATVERIIRKHGGRIWAESELDKGATFYFTFDGLNHNSGNGA